LRESLNVLASISTRGWHEYSMAMADVVQAIDEAQLRDLAYYLARFH
jgi:hypothetical protein